MSDVLDRFDDSVSDEVRARIEPVCREFEQVWQDGSRPDLLEYLQRVPGSDREPLLRELLPLDIDYRRARGSDPLPEEYFKDFSTSTILVHAVFSRIEEAEALAGADTSENADTSPTVQKTEVIECPHCGDDVQVQLPRPESVICGGCGNTIEFDPKATSAYPVLPETIGRLTIQGRLGHGGFGVVYKAHDPALDLTVAVKLARPETMDTDDKRERFLRDARAAARLKHPHIVQAHTIGYHNEIPYIVTDFVDGVTLDDRISAGDVTFRETAELVLQIADALDYAHSEGVVHRDVKPGNIMLDRFGKTCLTDFGLAHRDDEEIRVTLPGQVLGTPAYMSPEQAAGNTQETDRRTDVYSLGVVMYELLTGELPFRGKRRMLLHQILNDDPKSPKRLNDRVPRDLETICLKCLEKDPGRRYQTAGELRADVYRYLQGQPIEARPITRLDRMFRFCRRNLLTVSLVGAIFVLLAVICGMLVLDVIERREEEKRVRRDLQAIENSLEERTFTVFVSGSDIMNDGGFAELGTLAEEKIVKSELLEFARDQKNSLLQLQQQAGPEGQEDYARILGKIAFRLHATVKHVSSPDADLNIKLEDSKQKYLFDLLLEMRNELKEWIVPSLVAATSHDDPDVVLAASKSLLQARDAEDAVLTLLRELLKEKRKQPGA